MINRKSLFTGLMTFSVLSLLSAGAMAYPVNGGHGFQEAAAPLADQIHQFHNLVLMPVITFISLLILALLIWVCFKYNSKSNPNPSRFSHNTMVEVIWTVLPIFILLYIAVFSFPLLFDSDVIPDGKHYAAEAGVGTEAYEQQSETDFVIANNFPDRRKVTKSDHVEVYKTAGGERSKLQYRRDYRLSGLKSEAVTVSLTAPLTGGEELDILAGRSRVGASKFLDLFGEDRSQIITAPTINIKATGFQWGWSYSYPDEGDFEFSALLAKKDTLEDPSKYLFEATLRIVVPVNETVRVLTQGRDVIHSWTVPAFGIKVDAVPGRTNETWFLATQEGVFYGQCSEICGKDHAFMPIAVEVVSREAYEAWADSQRALAGLEPKYNNDNTKLAAVDGAQPQLDLE